MNERNRRSYMRLILTQGLSNPVVQLIDCARGGVRAGVRARGCRARTHDAGELLGFFVALGSITQPLKELIGVAGPIQQAVAAGQNIFATLDAPSSRRAAPTVARARGAVEIERSPSPMTQGSGPHSTTSA